MEHGKKYEPVALKECEKYMRKMGKPVKVIKSGLFVSPKIPILGCSPDAKVVDLSCKDNFGLEKSNVPPQSSMSPPLMPVRILASFWKMRMGSPN